MKKTPLILNTNIDLLTIINKISPSELDIKNEINDLIKSYPNLSKEQLSEKFTQKVITHYPSVGIGTALPSVIPGVGTIGQITIEGTTMLGDLLMMLRYMVKICYGIGILNDKDMNEGFNQEFIQILGIWSGVIISSKIAVEKLGTKVVITQFNKNVSGKIFQKINKKVGTTIITKWGTKRGGIAVGKLIPFGVGALVSGGFNYYTMKGFTKAALQYYSTSDLKKYYIIE